jgi:hypothetical protein
LTPARPSPPGGERPLLGLFFLTFFAAIHPDASFARRDDIDHDGDSPTGPPGLARLLLQTNEDRRLCWVSAPAGAVVVAAGAGPPNRPPCRPSKAFESGAGRVVIASVPSATPSPSDRGPD